MKLFMKPHTQTAWEFYQSHGHFHKGDAGLDLYVLEDIHFEAGETKAIKMGISCEPEDGTAYYLLPRSSISKTPLRLANSIGLIDGGYRGELIAFCDNISEQAYTVEAGQRLFQVVAMDGAPLEIEIVSELSESSRGDGGFGSTGS